MGTTQEAQEPSMEEEKGGLVRFFASDHRYVLLGTSVVALIGMWFSMQPRSSQSFLANVYALEVVMYYALMAWVVVSLVALVTKLVHWRDYQQKSPFAKPAAKHVERICSYVVWLFSAVLFVDRAIMGFVAIVKSAVGSNANPQDFVGGMVYMVYKGRGIFARASPPRSSSPSSAPSSRSSWRCSSCSCACSRSTARTTTSCASSRSSAAASPRCTPPWCAARR